ncbi:hypothetical protein J010_05348 [Cryptococcus neoformans]|nr:hypothetical protein C355_00916 [Cryptococcus neoformans var. grubii Th84]OXH04246.1 hypothetical protein J010_05348 [Cryptococcus neoformans var. grubii]OXH26048.1 hypothetical protein J009_05350 [Cryptococcus neoformans var. grubii]OXH45824.1 hypothetical protein J004_05404 [Cryptococcus neoformans var. grubii]OXH46762.1 hypothetical protein J003_05296 [Cryptococcus neoformans var. grubii]
MRASHSSTFFKSAFKASSPSPSPAISSCPLKLTASHYTLSTIIGDVKKMKKASVVVVLQLDGEDGEETFLREFGSNVTEGEPVWQDKTYEKISVPVESIIPGQVSTFITNTTTQASVESIHGVTSASTSTETSPPLSMINDLDHDPFRTSPVKVQVVRSYNYLGVSDKLRSFPPVHPNSIHAHIEVNEVMKAFMDHCKPKHAFGASEITESTVSTITHSNEAKTASQVIVPASPTTSTEDDDTVAFTAIPAGTPTDGHGKSDSIDSIFTMYLGMSDVELSLRDRSTAISPSFDEADITSSIHHDGTTEEGFAVITTPEILGNEMANKISPKISIASKDHASSDNDSFTTAHDLAIEDSPAYPLPAVMDFSSIDTAPLDLSLPIPTFPAESYYSSSSAMSIPDIIITPNHSTDSADHFIVRKALDDKKDASFKNAFVIPSELFEKSERKYPLPSIQRPRTTQQSTRNYRPIEKVPSRFIAARQRYGPNNDSEEGPDKESQDTFETPALNVKPRIPLVPLQEEDFKPVRQSSKSCKANRITPVKSSSARNLPRTLVLADRFSLRF